MSSVRECRNCKWVFANSDHREKCRFCGTKFELQWCIGCNDFVPDSRIPRRNNGRKRSHCNKCLSASTMKNRDPELLRLATARHDARRRAKWDKLFDKFKKNLPTKPMTEDEWYEVCEYFGGCAICGDAYIETRQFFMNFQDGGKYTAWNMFPLCGKCSTHTKFVENPFIWLDRRLGHTRKIGITEERRNKMLKYFMRGISSG